MEGKHVATHGKHLKTGVVPKRSRRTRTKALALVLTLMLTVGGVIGGTVAWLTAAPEPVVNTFTYGDINITLSETDTQLDGDNNPLTNQYKMLPGQPITKDPVITVKAGSEEMWLFVKLEKSANFDSFMEYAVEDGWTPLEGVDSIYYRHVTAEEIANADITVKAIKNNTVTVKNSVTKDMLNALDAVGGPGYPTLTVTGYAVQYAGNPTAAEAWGRVTDPTTPETP